MMARSGDTSAPAAAHGTLAADADARDKARRRAHAARAASTTCSICGASFAGPRRRPRAGRHRRPRPGPRPLRDRRAPDLRLRGADRVARGARARRTRCARPSASWSSTRRTRPSRMRLPWTFSTFDYRELCGLLWEQCDAEFETAKVEAARSRRSDRSDHDRPRRLSRAARRRRARLAAGARRGDGYQPPDAPLSRGLEVHPWGAGDELEIWIDRGYVPGRLRLELPGRRRGPGRRRLVRPPPSTSRSRPCGWPSDLEREPVRYQGNWIPHRLRPATDDGVFFVGDSAGHCLPLTAEGIRTAFYFGIACGRELRARRRGPRERATTRCAATRAFSAAPRWKFEWMLRVQRAVPRVPPRLLAAGAARRWSATRSSTGRSATTWTSRRPSFAQAAGAAISRRAELSVA